MTAPAASAFHVEPALSVQNLRLDYATSEGGLAVLAIDAFSLPVASSVALMGPSGCGKTSLLHVLCGITRPTAGQVCWFGQDLTAMRQAAADRWRWQQLGMVFQQFHLVETMTALQNVLLPLQFGRVADKAALRRRAIALLEQVAVRPQQTVNTLSRGQMQRVAIARALLRSPPIVLADEPTASLDATQAEQVMNLLRELCAERHATLLVATHDARLAQGMAQCYRLDAGRLRAEAA